jgi:hypothetical protein
VPRLAVLLALAALLIAVPTPAEAAFRPDPVQEALIAGQAVPGTAAVAFDLNHDGIVDGRDWHAMRPPARSRCALYFVNLNARLQTEDAAQPFDARRPQVHPRVATVARALVPRIEGLYRAPANRTLTVYDAIDAFVAE